MNLPSHAVVFHIFSRSGSSHFVLHLTPRYSCSVHDPAQAWSWQEQHWARWLDLTLPLFPSWCIPLHGYRTRHSLQLPLLSEGRVFVALKRIVSGRRDGPLELTMLVSVCWMVMSSWRVESAHIHRDAGRSRPSLVVHRCCVACHKGWGLSRSPCS